MMVLNGNDYFYQNGEKGLGRSILCRKNLYIYIYKMIDI